MKRVLIVAVFAVVMIPQTIVADFVSEDRAAQVARRILGEHHYGVCCRNAPRQTVSLTYHRTL